MFSYYVRDGSFLAMWQNQISYRIRWDELAALGSSNCFKSLSLAGRTVGTTIVQRRRELNPLSLACESSEMTASLLRNKKPIYGYYTGNPEERLELVKLVVTINGFSFSVSPSYINLMIYKMQSRKADMYPCQILCLSSYPHRITEHTVIIAYRQIKSRQ